MNTFFDVIRFLLIAPFVLLIIISIRIGVWIYPEFMIGMFEEMFKIWKKE